MEAGQWYHSVCGKESSSSSPITDHLHVVVSVLRKREARNLLQHQAYSLVLSALQSAELQPVVKNHKNVVWGEVDEVQNNYITTI